MLDILLVVVLIVWTISSAGAFVGAAILGFLAWRDLRIVSADTRNMARRMVRRETAGILLRSAVVRGASTFLYVVAAVEEIRAPVHEPIDIGTALVVIALSAGTFGATARDLLARARISSV